MRRDRKARRPHHADGEPRAGEGGALAATTTPRSMAAFSSQVKEPVIIHWLGEMFDPALDGYWGHTRPYARRWRSPSTSSRTNAAKVDGVKISLLDKDKEIAMRRRLPQGVRMYTGDDFNYAELIAGDAQGLFRRAARHFRRDRAGGRGGARRVDPRRHARRSTTSWRRPCRCRVTSSRRRRASTRPAWCSWPISTACRIISPWSAARRARARPCISPSCSGSPMPPGLLADPDRAAGRMRIVMAAPRRAGVMRDLSNDRSLLVDQLDDGEAVVARAARRRLRPRRHFRDLALARHRAGLRRRDAPASLSARTE